MRYSVARFLIFCSGGNFGAKIQKSSKMLAFELWRQNSPLGEKKSIGTSTTMRKGGLPRPLHCFSSIPVHMYIYIERERNKNILSEQVVCIYRYNNDNTTHMNKEIIEYITINYMDILDTVCYIHFAASKWEGGGYIMSRYVKCLQKFITI